MKGIIIITLFLNFSISFCYGQNTNSIHGNIIDRTTNIPIEYANVTYLKNDSSFLKGTVTDSTGYFFFEIEPNQMDRDYILQITHINYDKKLERVHINGNSKVTIPLEPKYNSLSEVEIIGIQTKTKNRLNLEYTISDKLREESMRASQLLENIPTVFVDYNQNVFIKGSSRILILRNGIELPSNSIIDQIPPSTIKKVEILHTIPSKYANKNYTAIMNIITKRESNISLLLDNNSSFDGKMYDAKVNLSIDTQRHSFYTFYKLYYRNFLEKNSVRNNYTSREAVQSDTTLFFRTKPRKESDNEFFYGYSFQPNDKLTLGVDGYLSFYREKFHSVYDNEKRTKYANFKESFNTQNYKGYVNYRDSLNRIQGIVSFNHIKVNDDFVYFNDNEKEEKQEEKRKTFSAQLDYRRIIKDNISVTAGAEYSYVKNQEYYSDLNSVGNNSEDFNGNNISAYAESTFEFNDKWALDIGINIYNYKRSFENNVTTKTLNFYPKLNVSYSFDDKNNLRISYSSYINNPSLWQMLSFTKEESPGIIYSGNPYLKPEKYGTLLLEYSYSKGNFYYSNSLFWKQTKNAIQNITYLEENNYLMTYTNLDKRNDYGIDLTLSWGITQWWALNGYMDVRYRKIPENKYYKDHLFSYSGNIQSSWGITPKLSLIVQYMYNSKELTYNGYAKSYNSSLVVVSYRLLEKLNLYFLAIEPFAKFNSYSKIYNEAGFIERKNTIKTRTFLVSFTYNLFQNKKQTKRKVYYNEEKKY